MSEHVPSSQPPSSQPPSSPTSASPAPTACDVDVAIEHSADLIRSGHARQAVAMLKKALQRSPGEWRLHAALGEALLADQRAEEAIGSLMSAVRINPDLAPPCVQIGKAFLSRGMTAPAQYWLRRAMQLDPTSDEHFALLAVAESRIGLRDEVVALLDAWVAADPKNPIRRHLAIAILGERTPPKAEDTYVEKLFDAYAEKFDESLARLKYCGPELIQRAVERSLEVARLNPLLVQRRARALDAGCGTGLLGPILRPFADHLTGVDLSPNMLNVAARRQVYDALCQGEMTAWLLHQPDQFDLIAVADALTYTGCLEAFMSAARGALRSGGLLALLVETLPEQSAEAAQPAADYRLFPNGRFAHAVTYVRRMLVEHDLTPIALESTAMRNECGSPVPSLLVAAQAGGALPLSNVGG